MSTPQPIPSRFSGQYYAGPVALYLEDLQAIHTAAGLTNGGTAGPLPKIEANVDHSDPRSLECTHAADTFEDLRPLLGDRVKRTVQFTRMDVPGDALLTFTYSPVFGCALTARGDGAEVSYRRIVDRLQERRRRWLGLATRVPPWAWLAAGLSFEYWRNRPTGWVLLLLYGAGALMAVSMYVREAMWSAGGLSKIYLSRRHEHGAAWANERRAFWGRVASSVAGGLILVVLTALITRSCSR